MNDLVINGKSKVSGGTFGKVSMDGTASIEGDLECEEMALDGVCRFKGRVRVKGMASVDGICKVSGSMEVEDIILDGKLIAASLTAENARLNGSVNLEGTFNAGTLELKFHGSSKVREVVGGRISVRRGKSARCFHADAIEGDDIDIERTKADVVRGDSVSIGPGCVIGRVEYRGTLEVHPKAFVRESVKAGQGG
ncbi:MAG: hypothetical protein FWH47_01220 [Methanomassiliicoccaceae archaeon]|nr:hypothetical protein [Methanomassiliicoccaceae archaeon]